MKNDKKTMQIAAELIARFDAAVKREDLREMEHIVATVSASPNHAFKHEVMAQLGAI